MLDTSMKDTQGCLDWDAVIGKGPNISGESPRLIEEGDYIFDITGLTRERTTGEGKLPPCNKAELTLRVDDGNGPIDVKCSIVLHKKLEWKINAFFKSIGQKKSGESMQMDWDSVVGCKGYAHFKPTEFIGRDGRSHTINSCEKFLPFPEGQTILDEQEEWTSCTEDGDPLPF